ncbi:MAG: hypothetical protein F4X30_04540, partial [Acidimicrobiaceae bacterium]|nr:hypothetical protein [Acidimicrobiaceae bacterium]
MVEVPEYLLERSRQRRTELTGASPEGGAAPAAEAEASSAAPAPAAATPVPAAPAPVPGAAPPPG